MMSLDFWVWTGGIFSSALLAWLVLMALGLGVEYLFGNIKIERGIETPMDVVVRRESVNPVRHKQLVARWEGGVR